jgi:hypothetical protein
MDVAAWQQQGKRWAVRGAGALLLLTVLGSTLWMWITLSYVYATGERVGFVQKLSAKGWVCKTYEGELMMLNFPGQPPQSFAFSVRDRKIVEQINQAAGHKVAIHYEQHKGVPTSCFGETEYFITAVRNVE